MNTAYSYSADGVIFRPEIYLMLKKKKFIAVLCTYLASSFLVVFDVFLKDSILCWYSSFYRGFGKQGYQCQGKFFHFFFQLGHVGQKIAPTCFPFYGLKGSRFLTPVRQTKRQNKGNFSVRGFFISVADFQLPQSACMFHPCS